MKAEIRAKRIINAVAEMSPEPALAFVIKEVQEIEDHALQRARAVLHSSKIPWPHRDESARLVRLQMNLPNRYQFDFNEEDILRYIFDPESR